MSKPMTPADIFECIKCGDCCKGYGGTYVTAVDIEAICKFIGADPQTFIKDYCQMSGDKPVLAIGPDDYCIFWDTLCTIHPVKPRMCRRWPFIPSVLLDAANWHIMGGMCAGIRCNVSDKEIIACVKAALENTTDAAAKRPANPSKSKPTGL